MMKLDHAITIIPGPLGVATACRHNIPRRRRPRQNRAKAKACREATLECSQTRQCLVAVECNTRPSGTEDLPSPFPGQKSNYHCKSGPSPTQSNPVQPSQTIPHAMLNHQKPLSNKSGQPHLSAAACHMSCSNQPAAP